MRAITNIGTAEELYNIRNNLSEAYVLTADIDLSSYLNWEPIGSLNNPFTGSLDFAGHTISNLTIDRPTQDYVGLFGAIKSLKAKYAPGDNSVLSSPIMKDGKFTNANVTGRDFVGVFTGYYLTDIGQGNSDQASEYGFLCENFSVSGSVEGRNKVGAFCGYAVGPLYAGSGPSAPSGDIYHYFVYDQIIGFKNIETSVVVTATGEEAGGIVGNCTGVRLSLCNDFLGVTADQSSGGIVGKMVRAGIEYCKSFGDVTAAKWIAGGICGIMIDSGDLRKVASYGNITTQSNHPIVAQEFGSTAWSESAVGVGGIVGAWIDVGFIKEACSFGNISGERAGGLIGTAVGGGFCTPNLSSCFSRGEISGHNCAGGLIGMHMGASNGDILDLQQAYVANKVTSVQYAGAVIGHKGPVYWEDIPGLTPPDYKGSVQYINNVIVNSSKCNATNVHGGMFYAEKDMMTKIPYASVWREDNELRAFGAKYSDWILSADIDVFPVLRWMHRPRSTMLSAVWSKTMGLVMGYSQTSRAEHDAFDQKVFLRRYAAGAWGEPIEAVQLDGSNPRLNLTATRDGRVCAVSDVDGDLHFAATDINSPLITESQNTAQMEVEGVYGGILQTSESGIQLFYHIPYEEIQALLYIDSNYTGLWANSEFKTPVIAGSGTKMSFLRAKAYNSLPFFSYRANGKHYILFPNIPWGEAPALPMPTESDPKYRYEVTVLDEYGSPLVGAEVSIVMPYNLGTVTKYTDDEGKIQGADVFELWALNYQITVSMPGYNAIMSQFLSIRNSTAETFTLYLLRSNVTFTVTGDEDGVLAGASVVFNEETKETDANGQVTFFDVLMGEYEYTITKEYFYDLTDDITVDLTVEMESPYLTKYKGTVTFTVIDDTTLLPISGALVTLDGVQIATGVDGTAQFADIWYGPRDYEVAATGYITQTGEILLEDVALAVPIQMSV